MPWRKKAQRIIHALCSESYAQNNYIPGEKEYRLRQKHKPYSVPPLAQSLVEALGQDDEERVKGLFLIYDKGVGGYNRG